MVKESEIKKAVRDNYGSIARQSTSCCGSGSACCGGGNAAVISKNIGYSDTDIASVPDGANLGLGCGNPIAFASLEDGETVLDLGSGAGFDCFLAAGRVGKKGKVIGVDMTPEMLERARENAAKGNYTNVEFRLGEIEHLPIADSSVDVIISNCVINLAPEKNQVFKEAFRVLKNGGRLMVSDIVLLDKLPSAILESVFAYVGCIAGASLKDAYISAIKAADFRDVVIQSESGIPIEWMDNDPLVQSFIRDSGISINAVGKLVNSIRSVAVKAVK